MKTFFKRFLSALLFVSSLIVGLSAAIITFIIIMVHFGDLVAIIFSVCVIALILAGLETYYG
jgi:hypothetical protein